MWTFVLRNRGVQEASQESRPHEPDCVFAGEAKGMRRESKVLGPETPWKGKSHMAIVNVRIHAPGRGGRAAKANELQPGLRLVPSPSQPTLRGGGDAAERPFILKPPPTSREAAEAEAKAKPLLRERAGRGQNQGKPERCERL